MKIFACVLCLCLMVAFGGGAVLAHAQVTYFYTGNSFNTCVTTCSGHITGWFTVPTALGPGNGRCCVQITPSAFYFTDNNQLTITQLSPDLIPTFGVGTDGSGKLIFWGIDLLAGTSAGTNYRMDISTVEDASFILETCPPGTPGPICYLYNDATYSPGTWTVSGINTGLTITLPPALQLPSAAWKDASMGFNTYEATLIATGGVPPYDWIVTGLPIGISVNPTTGVLSGTFSQVSEDVGSFDRINGLFNISVTVSDSAGATDSVSLAIPFTCGGSGDEDKLIGQYTSRLGSTPTFGQYGIRDTITSLPFAPRCMDITRSARSTNYTFTQLNSSNMSVLPNVALVANSLLTGQGVAYFLTPPLFHGPGLDAWVANYGSKPTLTSDYRNPADQLSVYRSIGAAPVRGGRHMFGDAADLEVSPHGTDSTGKVINPAGAAAWKAMLNAALAAGADFTESDPYSTAAGLRCSPAKMWCVHADWRWATQPFSLGGMPYAQ